MYHYTESGLPYVWLADGYRLEQTPYGETLSIRDVDSLHRAMARWIVETLSRLSGREVKFLRLEMDSTQAELAEQLGVTEQSISLWERQPAKAIPPAADRLLRLVTEAWLEKDQPLAQAMARIEQAEHGQIITRQHFKWGRKQWRAAKAA